jgi:hypothetical protein
VSGKFVMKATVEARRVSGVTEWVVELEGSGFTGRGNGYAISHAFAQAHEELMARVQEAIFKEETK